jgi:hypothetical protein
MSIDRCKKISALRDDESHPSSDAPFILPPEEMEDFWCKYVKRNALANDCYDLAAAEQKLAAECHTDAVETRASAASLKAQEIEMLLRATQNPARAVEYQVWWVEYRTYAAKYLATSTPAQAANWEALRDMLRLMEILQGFQELITAKKASIVIVGQFDSFQIIHPLLAFLQIGCS